MTLTIQSNESHDYFISGLIIGLDGQNHNFSFVFEWRYGGDEKFERTPPTLRVGIFTSRETFLTLGPSQFTPVEGEIELELNTFLSEVRDTLAIQETKNVELFEFLSNYMIPNRTAEDKEDLWAEINQVVEGKLEEVNNTCNFCQGDGATIYCSGCDEKFHNNCITRKENEPEEEEVWLCKECMEEQ